MQTKKSVFAAGIVLAFMTVTANAALVINVDQIGGNVVAKGVGSLDIAGLNNSGTYTLDVGIRGYSAYIGAGTQGSFVTGYYGLTGPTAIGSDFNFYSASTSTGDTFAFNIGSGNVFVTPGFNSGELNFTTAFDNTTIGGLGLTAGKYTYNLPNDTFTVNVGVSTVPLPASAPMFGAALLALAGFGYGMNRWVAPKGKKAAAAA